MAGIIAASFFGGDIEIFGAPQFTKSAVPTSTRETMPIQPTIGIDHRQVIQTVMMQQGKGMHQPACFFDGNGFFHHLLHGARQGFERRLARLDCAKVAHKIEIFHQTSKVGHHQLNRATQWKHADKFVGFVNNR